MRKTSRQWPHTGILFRKAREELKVSQHEMGKIIGCPVSRVITIESGVSTPNINHLKKWIKAYKISHQKIIHAILLDEKRILKKIFRVY